MKKDMKTKDKYLKFMNDWIQEQREIMEESYITDNYSQSYDSRSDMSISRKASKFFAKPLPKQSSFGKSSLKVIKAKKSKTMKKRKPSPISDTKSNHSFISNVSKPPRSKTMKKRKI